MCRIALTLVALTLCAGYAAAQALSAFVQSTLSVLPH